MAKRRNFTDQFKAKVALEALRGDKTVQEIAAKHQLHPNQVSTWKRQAIEGMADVFSGGKHSGPTEAEVKDFDLPPAGPSFITRVCSLDFGIRLGRLAQARRARSPQIAQASGALAAASGWPGTSVA